MTPPRDIQLIGSEVAIAWTDGREDFFPMEVLRAASPSAEQTGERDIFGQQYGGSNQKKFEGVLVEGFSYIGGYAVRFDFSDGHNSGIYSYEYLKNLGDRLREHGANPD